MHSRSIGIAVCSFLVSGVVSCTDTVSTPEVERSKIRTEACTGVYYNLYANESSSSGNTWDVYGTCANDTPSDWWHTVYDNNDECLLYSDGVYSNPVWFGFTNFSIPGNSEVIVGTIDLDILVQNNLVDVKYFSYEVWMNDGTSDQLIASGSGSVGNTPTYFHVSVVDPGSNGAPYGIARINTLQVKISTQDSAFRIREIIGQAWGYVPGKGGCPEFEEG